MVAQHQAHSSLARLTIIGDEPITLAEAKTHLNILHDSDDTYITSLITVAREYCEQWTGRAIIQSTWRLTLGQFPDDQIIRLYRPPVISIDEISYIDSSGAGTAYTDYVSDLLAEPAIIMPDPGTSFPSTKDGHPQAVVIDFTAGYVPSGSGSSEESTVPVSLRQAMLLLIGHWYSNREAVVDGGMSQVPMAAESLLSINSYGAI